VVNRERQAGLRIDVDSAATRRDLKLIAERARDVRPAMEGIIDRIYDAAAKQFDSQGAYARTPWPANAESTVERKARLGLDPRVLHATLDLRDSLTHPGGSNFAFAQHNGLIFGTAVEYARYLDETYPLVVPHDAELHTWVRIVERWIIDGDPSHGGILGSLV